MAAGIGGFVAFPYTHLLMDLAVGWQTSLLVLALDHAGVLPVGLPLARQAGAGAGTSIPRRCGRRFKEAFSIPASGC